MNGSADIPNRSEPTPQQLGEALAAQIGEKEWVLDDSDLLENAQLPVVENADSQRVQDVPADLNSEFRIPNSELDAVPLAEAAVEAEIPPSPLQIVEALLFIGGQPLRAEKACEIVRGLDVEQFRNTIEVLNRVYRLQNRPYSVVSSDQGYALMVRPRYRSLKEKIFGGPREARLTQQALDVLALVAYRQPAVKNEIDAVRGIESGHILRQLVRLGLISVVQRAESAQREVCYGTTERFLELFNLRSLDDLPQTGDPQRL